MFSATSLAQRLAQLVGQFFPNHADGRQKIIAYLRGQIGAL
ncbi:MAG: hypothetical protein U0787_06770 [Polyangia bacterium]